MSSKPLVSLVVPVFNEEPNIEPFYEGVSKVIDRLSDRYEFEFVFTDNHSQDRTFALLAALAQRDARVRVFRFARNYGYQRSILTGYGKARGACAIQLDVDLQDPPELIPEFLAHWEAGNKVVFGIRRTRKEAWWINLVRKVFYRLIDILSEDRLPHDAGDFRLIDRMVIDGLLRLKDAQPYLRGSIATMGFEQKGVLYDRHARERGVSKFSVADLFRLALDGILNHSIVPLRMATYTGLFVSLVAVIGIFVYLVGKLWFGAVWPAGFTTLTILLLLTLGLNSLFLGVIGEYLGRIYLQLKSGTGVLIEQAVERE